jgi:hypothetical protein
MIEKGMAVEVVRGRKVPKGTKGVVRWVGSNMYGTSVGLVVEGNEKLVFTAITNVEPDESPEGKAAEAVAAEESAVWVAARKVENDAKKAEAEALLPGVKLAKGDKVMPSEGLYANRWCRVIWVGANRDGLRVGVKPVVKPLFRGGKAVWPDVAADWLPLSAVTPAESYKAAA